MFTSLKGRSAVVTGASSGIGKAMAVTFAREGCNVLAVARSEAKVKAVCDGIRKEGVTAEPFVGDVKSMADMRAMAEKAKELFGGVDILLSNAGIFPEKRLSEMTDEDYDNVMDTNVRGMFHAVWACQGMMKEKRRGRIILTSSITGPNTGFPGWAHYGASKAAQLGFMHTAAIELAPYGITVNAVSPGNVLSEGLLANGEDYIKQMARSVPLGKLGSPYDIANAALFLASDEAGFITSHNLIIDGGQIWPESLTALDSIRDEYKQD
ncbi:MAG: 3-oxoacyl-ACP reductase FabG [Aeromonadales bacterium]|nr:3-oxoacyl-ACP reductase FabG [Aeromonadales bacterium]MDY2891595.1 3-oxoacyl-ACP reductase FabG [Succinivibrio sp.]